MTTGLSTRCVHAGELADGHGSPHTPLYTTTTFKFASTADLLDVVDGRKPGSLYTRYGLNPTVASIEQKLAALEGAELAWAFCSGMAAETALFLTHGRKGIVCLGDAYGGTLELISSQLPLLGIHGHFLLGHELSKLDELLAQGAGLVFLETPTNPTLEIFDIQAIAKLAHAHGALVAVDNTFASPVNQNPLALDTDFVVHSCTKYLGGHSDLTAGVLMGSQDLLMPVWNWRKNLGTTIAPEIANLLARSIRSLPVRVRAQNTTAQAVAEAMARHPKVARVLYPGLPDFPGHALASKQMTGYGGMLTIEVKGSGDDATHVADKLKLFALAPSLGGVESLVTQPCTTTHHGLTPEERTRRGISDAMLRLSIGLEDAADLIADLDQALG
ncbi:MAG: aminotransferase class I/II-fold pyridoxal phosphate-dependent enzyme [Candidatus Dechloromonas phosphoritropha]|nr:aminotransferase class I/II-fold pyridoxal phosphate-dependent enzyme [Candidatus Dechloromonas phosphoritropha]MBP8787550.1 aminotransferase class I/II-fold pyridoxal phosphate-dependent enzyme [Azonexus sp.]MBP9228098.1 aminotransferase class I/II-fold pyridoxal phosphate-dependent enzyme [Azonexus sp.]